MTKQFWLDLFTGVTWQEFIDAGANVTGFRAGRWKTVQSIKPGDYLLCYLTGVSRFIAVLEVTSNAFQDNTPIWKDEDFPSRLRVKEVVTLQPETAVPIQELRDELSIFQNLTNPRAWTGRLRGSPQRWSSQDGEIILQALEDAKQNPIRRPVDPRKMARRPRALSSKVGTVTVPDDSDVNGEESAVGTDTPKIEATEHTEIQFFLLRLGTAMRYSTWVARNDRSRTYDGRSFSAHFTLLDRLPSQFDEATTRTVEFIDVLWLDGNAVVAAFEVESTTSVYSGLLRMSDLLAMQPNLNIPLYIVAPDERRQKVLEEVNRPTFSRLSPPLAEVCRFISFSALRSRVNEMGDMLRYLRPEFLEELSEECTLDD